MGKYRDLMQQYAHVEGGLIEAYHAVHREKNYLAQEDIIDAADIFRIPVKEAFGTASFYSYFSTKPRGKYVVRICESAPCHIAGADRVVAALEKELGIRMGETTADGKFTLELTQCVGQCQETPVITVNCKPHYGVCEANVREILAQYA